MKQASYLCLNSKNGTPTYPRSFGELCFGSQGGLDKIKHATGTEFAVGWSPSNVGCGRHPGPQDDCASPALVIVDPIVSCVPMIGDFGNPTFPEGRDATIIQNQDHNVVGCLLRHPFDKGK
jgi:hypothetical protein